MCFFLPAALDSLSKQSISKVILVRVRRHRLSCDRNYDWDAFPRLEGLGRELLAASPALNLTGSFREE